MDNRNNKPGVSLMDCLILIQLLVVLLFSCTSTKQVSKQTTTVEDTRTKELEDSTRLLTSWVNRLTSENEELKYNSVEFDTSSWPPTQIIIDERCNADSIRAILKTDFANEVKIHADGTIEAKGQLRRASSSLQKMQSVIAEQSRVIDSISKVKQKEKITTVTKTEYKDKYVKRSFMTGWWLFILGFACCFVLLNLKKIYSFIKPKI